MNDTRHGVKANLVKESIECVSGLALDHESSCHRNRASPGEQTQVDSKKPQLISPFAPRAQSVQGPPDFRRDSSTGEVLEKKARSKINWRTSVKSCPAKQSACATELPPARRRPRRRRSCCRLDSDLLCNHLEEKEMLPRVAPKS